MVRLRFQCLSIIARKRRLMWASRLPKLCNAESVHILKNSNHPFKYALMPAIQSRNDCPQFLGVSSRMRLLMRSRDRFDHTPRAERGCEPGRLHTFLRKLR